MIKDIMHIFLSLQDLETDISQFEKMKPSSPIK